MKSNKPIMKAFGYTLLLTLLIIPHVNVGQDFDEKLAEYKGKRLIQEFSIVGGPSVNFLRGNDAVDDGPLNERQYLIGYSFGAQIGTKNIIDKFSLSAGILFERKGGKSLSDVQYWDASDQTTKLGQQEVLFKYTYYTIPIRIIYSIGKTSKLKIGLGAYVSYLKKQTRETKPLFPGFFGSNDDETEFNSKTDCGLSASLSYRMIKLKPFSVYLQITNNLGLQNVRPDNLSSTMKTNSSILLVSLIF